MAVDVRTFVASCYFCQTHKHPPGGTIGELQPIPIPKKPFSLMGIDHVGPFKLTSRGNRHILVAVDYFSKWVVAKPVPDTSAIFIRDFIHQEVIGHHGYPERIISDRGSALASALFGRRIDPLEYTPLFLLRTVSSVKRAGRKNEWYSRYGLKSIRQHKTHRLGRKNSGCCDSHQYRQTRGNGGYAIRNRLRPFRRITS